MNIIITKSNMQKSYSFFGTFAALTVLVFGVMVAPSTSYATGFFDFPKFDYPDFSFNKDYKDDSHDDYSDHEEDEKDDSYDDHDDYSDDDHDDYSDHEEDEDKDDYEYEHEDYESSYSYSTCKLTANVNEVVAGNSVTLSWTVKGFSVVEINGQVVTGNTITFDNVQENTTYKLVAKSADGSKNCSSSVTIKCLPPPVHRECKLELHKSVDKTHAVANDTLTYTITIKNIGNIDCTGNGVKIEDKVDGNLIFLNQNTSSNIFAGYDGKPVYTESDRTLRFNGDTLNPNEQGTITWTAKVKSPTVCGDFEIPNQAKATAHELNYYKTWVYSNKVITAIDNECHVPSPECTLIAGPTIVDKGGASTITWTTKNSDVVTISTIGAVAENGSQTTGPLDTPTNYTLTASGYGKTVTCDAHIQIKDIPAPSCDLFTATPSTIVVGNAAELKWETTNATRVVINNGIGDVALDNGTMSVSPLVTTTYQLTVFGTNNQSRQCEVPVTVTERKVPTCDFLTATPSSFSFQGGTTTLAWSTQNATNISIAPTVGVVSAVGSVAVPVKASTTFILTAKDASGAETSCSAPVTLGNEPVFTCENNVTFTAANSSIRRGNSTSLNWNVKDADSVAVSVINATAFSGTQSVSPTSDTTYILTAKKGNKTIECPVPVTVSGGGGGGGSSSPRCELTISAKKIKLGDTVTLKWDTTRATEVTLTDDRGKVLMTTEDMKSSEKEKNYDGTLKVKPTRDTQYTLVAKKGSKDTDCKVKVEMDDLVILETRDQLPLVAGISLSQVPYTGFEAGPFLTFMFYALLAAWALYLTYLLISREKVAVSAQALTPNQVAMKQAEAVRPDVFTQSISAPTAPFNLPTGVAPVVGYQNAVDAAMITIDPHHANDALVTEIENRAHSQKALLSSDAVRHFVSTTEGSVERNEALDSVISEAKKSYPLEDGWIVINEARMRNLCETCQVAAAAQVSTPSINLAPEVVPQGTGSLAEAIVTGNIVAAYEMIGNRPMFSLADAAADLDAVYRNRHGENKSISNLLEAETAKLSNEKIKKMIEALTGALDGTYTDEASAVKMAIMKAVKEVA